MTDRKQAFQVREWPNGTPGGRGKPRVDPKIRVERNSVIDPDTGCWNWTGTRHREGYGQSTKPGSAKKQMLAHRLSYEAHVGPIADGMVIDHLCENRLCVNPDHMEVVMNGTNVYRGNSWAGKNMRKTHCVRGHEFTPENTRIVRRSNGSGEYRECRACRRNRAA